MASRGRLITPRLLAVLAAVMALVALWYALGAPSPLASSPTPRTPTAGTPPTGPTTVATVTGVSDGDTIRVELAGSGARERVRLLGIDTPELAHDGSPQECYAAQAHARAAELMPLRAQVDLVADPTQDDRDRHGRLLRYVEIDGIDVQAELVSAGFARAYPWGVPDVRAQTYADLEDAARAEGRGLWSVCR